MAAGDPGSDASTTDLSPGALFGNYAIVRKLGEGGMGAVYEARRQGLNKRVALKVLTLGGNPAVTARFVQEARISASLEHPNVADCFDVGEHEGVPYLALEFLDGETLGARMDRGPLGVSEIADVVLPVASALALAHGHGIGHRDLKPDNIFLARQLGAVVPKVLDFGIAKARGGTEHQGLTRTASIMGTPGYMSPEQARDSKNVGAASDQFALGVILWEAVTGRPLFEGDSSLEVLMKVVSQSSPSLRELRPEVDPAFESVVQTLLEKDPARRFPSMREVGAALLPFASPEARARWASEFSERASVPSREVFPVASSVPAPDTVVEAKAPAPTPRVAPNTLTPSGTDLTTIRAPRSNARRGVIVALAACALTALSIGAWLALRPDPATTVDPRSTTSALPPPSVIDAPTPPSAPTSRAGAQPAPAANAIAQSAPATPDPAPAVGRHPRHGPGGRGHGRPGRRRRHVD
ncbi:MAG: protein kinase [Polyangiales bacterium]